MLAKAGPSATPSVCLYMMSLKLNFIPDVALFISSMKTALEISGCASESSQHKASAQILMVSSSGTFVKRLEMSKEYMKRLSIFRVLNNISKRKRVTNTMGRETL